ncbi:MAG: FAD-dependent thymidylate synthase [Campylobacter sp.]|nr:FAD-dependent thymidylate synthase [Campylobacter sp.]MBR6612213.1 FAD-dependent thymidylate synthase [Campylobacter sp.]
MQVNLIHSTPMQYAYTLDFICFTFKISGISRALLQQLARHRISSLSTKSTRYTLRELKNVNADELKNYLVKVSDSIDEYNKFRLATIQALINEQNLSNDELKYLLPEAFKTELILTINARSLRNLLELRLSSKALKEFRELAKEIYKIIPETHRILFDDIVEKLNKEK